MHGAPVVLRLAVSSMLVDWVSVIRLPTARRTERTVRAAMGGAAPRRPFGLGIAFLGYLGLGLLASADATCIN